MAKIRVYELARELNIETKILVNRIKGMGINVSSHQSTLEDDQLGNIRSAIKSGADTSVLSVKPSSSPKVIRRRRRDEAAEQEELAATAAAEDLAKEQLLEESSLSSEIRVSDNTGEHIQVSARDIGTEKSQTPMPLHSPSQSTLEQTTHKVAKPFRPKGDISATIVRRATPEETELNRIQTDTAKVKRTSKKEDSRGTRVTGLGFASERSIEDEERLSKSVRRKDKKKTADEEDEFKRRPVVNRNKRAQPLTTRILLDQIEDQSADPLETEEVALLLVNPEEDAIATKTIYTPTVSHKKRDLKRRKDLKKTQVTQPRAEYRVVRMSEQIQISELAKQLSVKATEIIKKLMDQGMMVTINSPVDFDTACLIATDYHYEVKSAVVDLQDILRKSKDSESIVYQPRPPIVTVMGHVDHGKTSILDAIRNSNVASGEAGGITQHIGAHQIRHNNHYITFLDTPGHEAFSAMRARGAKVTDIVILVVAADDGVMPQTKEAISHAKDAKVPIIVAINKIDKPTKNLDRIYTELTEFGIQAEEWGGETQFVKVSALKRIGIDELLDAILLQAEMLELRAAENIPADGVVVEAHLDVGRGPVATVVVQSGVLKTGSHIVVGTATGKIRAMLDYNGRLIQEALPSMPVELIGLDSVPLAADKVDVVPDEKTAKDVVKWRLEQLTKVTSVKSSAQTLDDLLGKIQTQDKVEVPVIIKADTQGSVEAIADSILKLNTPKVSNVIIYQAVGGVTESDITLAQTAKAIIVAFNVRAQRGLDEVAEKQGVLIKYFSIIYDIVDVMKAVMVGKLPPVVKEVVIGHAEVRQTINVPKHGVIAGSAVVDGKITRSSQLRLIREDIVIYSGKVGSLRRFKDDVREVSSGYECGIGIDGYNDIHTGDVIEAFVLEEQAATLN